ncbi:MAG: zinc ribbon domain-containing protein [Candidatus Bathyarchaeota archaeon]|nr:zinc ribbon domain-containing protein [Candidatus Bathyarchaeota archaeon]
MSDERTKFCPYCGTMIPYIDTVCPACHEPQPIMKGMIKPKPVKKVWLAVFLAFLVTGLGQMYMGKMRRGVAFFVVTLVAGFIASYFYTYEQVITIGILFAIISAYDAYRLALDQ